MDTDARRRAEGARESILKALMHHQPYASVGPDTIHAVANEVIDIVADAVAQAVKDRDEVIQGWKNTAEAQKNAMRQQAEEIARLNLELSKTADLRAGEATT